MAHKHVGATCNICTSQCSLGPFQTIIALTLVFLVFFFPCFFALLGFPCFCLCFWETDFYTPPVLGGAAPF